MLLITLALETLDAISQNGFNQITLNKQIGNHLNRHIMYASSLIQSFIVANASWLRETESLFEPEQEDQN